MCLIFKTPKPEILRKPLIAYKSVTRRGKRGPAVYVSSLPPRSRSLQEGFRASLRTILEYRVGRTTRAAKDSPGVYLYTTALDAKSYHRDRVTLRCRVPAGAKVWWSRMSRSLTASRVKVLNEVKP